MCHPDRGEPAHPADVFSLCVISFDSSRGARSAYLRPVGRGCGPGRMEVSQAVALSGPVSWLPNRLPTAVGPLSGLITRCQPAGPCRRRFRGTSWPPQGTRPGTVPERTSWHPAFASWPPSGRISRPASAPPKGGSLPWPGRLAPAGSRAAAQTVPAPAPTSAPQLGAQGPLRRGESGERSRGQWPASRPERGFMAHAHDGQARDVCAHIQPYRRISRLCTIPSVTTRDRDSRQRAVRDARLRRSR
jgi:hypothetical protein